MAISLYCQRLHQLSETTQLHVDQTCPIGYILVRVLIQSRFKDLNQSDTSLIDAIGGRFEGVVPSHGGTHQ